MKRLKRLTDKRFLGEGFYQPKSREERLEIALSDKPSYEEIYKRLGEYENRGEKIAKGCEYCKGRAYTKKPVTLTTIYGRRTEMVIRYCPSCGRKLVNDDEV